MHIGNNTPYGLKKNLGNVLQYRLTLLRMHPVCQTIITIHTRGRDAEEYNKQVRMKGAKNMGRRRSNMTSSPVVHLLRGRRASVVPSTRRVL